MSGETWLDVVRQQLPLLLIAAAIGGTVGVIFDRYRRRLVRMQWSATHTIVAVSSEDPVFGTVEVTHDGNRVSKLYATTVIVTNQSGTDLSKVPIAITFPEGTTILQVTGGAIGEPIGAALLPEFVKEVQRVSKLPKPDAAARLRMAFLHRHRPFVVQTMNRRATARFDFLVDAPPPVSGDCEVSISLAGVRPVKVQANAPQVLGVEVRVAALTGLIAGIVALFVIGQWYQHPVGLASLAFVLAAFGQHFGAAVIRVGRWVRTVFD